MEKRSRAFQYTVDSPDESVLYQLHHITCEYHAYGYEENTIKGLIIFKHTKTETAVSKVLQVVAYKPSVNSYTAMTEIKALDNLWERGKAPQRIKARDPPKESLYEYFMQQNRALIENIMDEKRRLQEENKHLHHELLNAIRPQTITQDYSVNKRVTNINLFLNTDCKDAITLKEFVDQLEIKDEDIECMKTMGYVESVTQLLKRSLKEYEVHERPIHCTDKKREVIHVKHQDGWNREFTGNSPNIEIAFKHLTHIHRKKMADVYRNTKVESKRFEEKTRLMYEISSATGEQKDKYNKRIIQNIADNIHLCLSP